LKEAFLLFFSLRFFFIEKDLQPPLATKQPLRNGEAVCIGS